MFLGLYPLKFLVPRLGHENDRNTEIDENTEIKEYTWDSIELLYEGFV